MCTNLDQWRSLAKHEAEVPKITKVVAPHGEGHFLKEKQKAGQLGFGFGIP